MPIRPEEKVKYPKNWAAISDRIRFERAEGRCEFLTDDGERCTAQHGHRHPFTGAIVCLTVAHLNHDPADCSEENLRAGCQLHHNRWDAAYRLKNRRRRRRLQKKTLELFPD